MPKAAPDSRSNRNLLSRNRKLLFKKDFQLVFADSRKLSHRYILVLYRPNQRVHPRLGMVIPKTRVKLAVERNLLRRIVRESFRRHQENLKGLDLIVLIRSECTPLSGKKSDRKTLREDVDSLWRRLETVYKPA